MSDAALLTHEFLEITDRSPDAYVTWYFPAIYQFNPTSLVDF